MSKGIVWLVGVGILAALSIFLYFSEWIEIPLGSRFGDEALKNRYLAAHRFLQRLDVDVASIDGLSLLDDLPAVDSTLVIASSRRTLSARRQAALEEWLDAGGHLVVVPGAEFDEETSSSGDALLDGVGIAFYLAEANEDDGDTPKVDVPATLEDLTSQVLAEGRFCGEDAALATLSFEGSPQAYVTAFPTRGFLYYEDEEDLGYAYNDAGMQMLRVAVGGGMLTVVTALSPWDNRRIGCHDHAHTLRLLMADRPRVFWLFNTEMLPLTQIIWDRFAALICVLAVALIAWVWRSGYRVGPVRARGSLERRALMEHVEGVAQFLWQNGDQTTLVDAMRTEVKHKLAAHALSLPDDGARVSFLAERAGLDEGVVHWSLESKVPHNRGSFKQMMVVLQQLRRSL